MRFFAKLLAAFSLLVVFAAPAMAQTEAPSGAIFDYAPFNSGALFSTINCGVTFACDTYATPEQYIALANQCAVERFSFPPEMLIYFETSGQYENCALPGSFVPKVTGDGSRWPICCISPLALEPGMCQFICHSYLGNG